MRQLHILYRIFITFGVKPRNTMFNRPGVNKLPACHYFLAIVQKLDRHIFPLKLSTLNTFKPIR